ncbi:translocation complex component [Purpureocillium lilacinum]|uniref:Translocation complex component n=1 Tax=Purpureocillium lilacinum TaxID=33203 RepID=A0A179HIG9_PURLI|nr:translocation complex component [Purpureocillium lilacinum]OAQ89418.1 translocation complex component [Purpureocillium lilacinum]
MSSSDYSYDDQVSPILPLLHPDAHGPGHDTPDVQRPASQQERREHRAPHPHRLQRQAWRRGRRPARGAEAEAAQGQAHPCRPRRLGPHGLHGLPDHDDRSATEKQIKSHYKRLSVKFHPDKVRPDASKNETVESLNDHYVELTKAYQALTDEEVRNNYIQYGHPDGKQSFSIGIALPKFIISDGNGKYLVLLYTGLLGVLLPYLVGSWWYGTKKRSKEGVLMESANNLFRQYDESMDEAGIITALSAGKEFETVLKGDQADHGLSKIESRITADGEASLFAAGFSVKDKEKLEDLDSGVRRKALALLWAYLGRVELDDPALTKAKYDIAPIARMLNQSFATIALAYGNIGPIAGSFYANQHIIQAISPKSSPLLQLPYFTPKIAMAVEGDSKTHLTVQQFMDLPDAQRRKLAVGKGLLTDNEYKTAVSVGKQLPYLRVAKAFFKVTGERVIIPSALVTLVIKGRFVPPGTEKVPAVNELDLEDIDAAEDDLDALMGRKSKTIKGPDGKPISVEEQSILPPLTFAPHFAREQTPKWYAFLSDSKQGKMAVPPFTFDRFDQPIFDEQGKPTFNMQTLKAQFAAPPQPGHYTFVMHVVCDSYVGFDTKMEVTLVVEDAAKAAEMEWEDEISEPEEGKPPLYPSPKDNVQMLTFADSVAGQMHALRTGEAPQPRRRKDQEEESDDESGTEEEEDDTSDTNTDTEDES